VYNNRKYVGVDKLALKGSLRRLQKPIWSGGCSSGANEWMVVSNKRAGMLIARMERKVLIKQDKTVAANKTKQSCISEKRSLLGRFKLLLSNLGKRKQVQSKLHSETC